MNLLIVKLSAIGDVIHTLPSLAALRRHFPAAHITWVVEEAASDLLTDHPHLDRVLISHRRRWQDDLKRGRVRQPLRAIAAFLGDLRSRPYDLVIDFHGLFKSALLVGLSGGRRKLGYDSLQEGSGLFYTEKIPEDLTRHAVDRYLDFARHLGIEPGKAEFLIPDTADQRGRIDSLLQGLGIAPRERFIALSPVAFWETKLWEEARFSRLGDRIRRELGLPVVLTDGACDYTARIARGMTEAAVNLGGRTTLRELAALYRRAALLVTTDSGPMHLAAAVVAPVVALFGPTDPRRTGPYGPGHTVLESPVDCRPCFRKTCETRQCMRDITVDAVFEAVREKLTDRRQKMHAEKTLE